MSLEIFPVRELPCSKQKQTWRAGEDKMKNLRGSKLARVIVISSMVGALVASGGTANAATKTITCYKGKVVKKVTATKPKCPTGYTTKKPVTTAATGAVAFSGTYKGKISMLWSDSDVRATSVTGVGTGNISGLTALTGTGSAAPASQCDAFIGTGVLGTGANTLKVSFDPASKACADSSAAPADITLTGFVIVNGGTGKFAGATGKLKVTGSFSIKSTTAGSSESSSFTLTFTGDIKTK